MTATINKKYNIIIADDHALFRQGLKLLLSNYNNINVLAEAVNGVQLLEFIELLPIDLAIVDIDMPIMDGIEASQRILRKFPNIKIIALSMYGDKEYYFRMLDAGASGFILKDSEIDEVYSAIIAVMEGKNYFSQALMQNIINDYKNGGDCEASVVGLSAREIEIVSLLCKGYSTNEIADYLCISNRTVETHRYKILEKTDSKNTVALVMYAIKNKIVKL